MVGEVLGRCAGGDAMERYIEIKNGGNQWKGDTYKVEFDDIKDQEQSIMFGCDYLQEAIKKSAEVLSGSWIRCSGNECPVRVQRIQGIGKIYVEGKCSCL